jgi:hypothetical protein
MFANGGFVFVRNFLKKGKMGKQRPNMQRILENRI